MSPRSQAGFTLMEMVVAIVITSIVAGIVAVFIRSPVQGYVDAVRRAELTDNADVALRRIGRDVRLALPNSLRVANVGGTAYIEFIPTSGGGRYRDVADGSTGGNFLRFTASTASFDVLGALPSFPAIAPGDYIVVNNLGTAPADAYGGGNRVQVDAAWTGGNPVVLTAATRTVFSSQSPPLPSPGARFQVVPGGVQAVTYACPTAGAGQLVRYWGYGFNAAQATPPGGGSSALLAGNAVCQVEYAANATGRNGLLYVKLTLSDPASGESAALFHQIHMDNSP